MEKRTSDRPALSTAKAQPLADAPRIQDCTARLIKDISSSTSRPIAFPISPLSAQILWLDGRAKLARLDVGRHWESAKADKGYLRRTAGLSEAAGGWILNEGFRPQMKDTLNRPQDFRLANQLLALCDTLPPSVRFPEGDSRIGSYFARARGRPGCYVNHLCCRSIHAVSLAPFCTMRFWGDIFTRSATDQLLFSMPCFGLYTCTPPCVHLEPLEARYKTCCEAMGQGHLHAILAPLHPSTCLRSALLTSASPRTVLVHTLSALGNNHQPNR